MIFLFLRPNFQNADYAEVGSRPGKNQGVMRGLSDISGDRRYSLVPKDGVARTGSLRPRLLGGDS